MKRSLAPRCWSSPARRTRSTRSNSSRSNPRGRQRSRSSSSAPSAWTSTAKAATEKDGSLLLKQTIHEPGKPPRMRYWRMRQTGPKLSRARSPTPPARCGSMSTGHRVRIRYKGKDHLDFDQLLPRPARKPCNNHMRVKRFGITVAHFDRSRSPSWTDPRDLCRFATFSPIARRIAAGTDAVRQAGCPNGGEAQPVAAPFPDRETILHERPRRQHPSPGQTNRFTVCSRR